MDHSSKLLSGREIVHHKLNGPKELPASGWKEYCPINSWLEKKQIQTCLEEQCLIIGVERVEKQNNLAQAEWIKICKKAKVTKKVGKHWEVVGHHQDNEDWLFPEEALYLIEINVLELYYSGVPLSVELAYALLLGENHGCTLQEYRVYSYLSRRGYKLLRHAEEITVTRYEKQVHLDQIIENQKRSIPIRSENSCMEDHSTSSNKNIKKVDIIKHDESSACTVREISKHAKAQIKRTPCDSEDVCIIEDNIEVIEIEDNTFKKSSPVKFLALPKVQKSVKPIKKSDCIIIIDDEEEEDEEDGVDSKQEFDNEIFEVSDDDTVLVGIVRFESRSWYRPLEKCLLPFEIVVDLSEDPFAEIKIENDFCSGPNQVVASKSRSEILNEITNAKSGVSFIKSPGASFLPKKIIPKHPQYRVNLNVRPEPAAYYQSTSTLGHPPRRPFYNSNFFNFTNQRNHNFFGDNVFLQAYEMRAMAISMIQAASSLMSAFNNQASGTGPPMINDLQILPFYNPQFNPNYTPRLLNHNVFNNTNFVNTNVFGNQRGSFARNGCFSSGKRNFRFRGNYRNNTREFSPYQRRQASRFNRNLNNYEVVLLDSDDDNVRDQRQKRRNNILEVPTSKKSRSNKSFEIIDLSEENVIKDEPEINASDVQNQEIFNISAVEREKDDNKYDHPKPNIIRQCKQEVEDEINTVVIRCEKVLSSIEKSGNLKIENRQSIQDVKKEKDDNKKGIDSEKEVESNFKQEPTCNQLTEITDTNIRKTASKVELVMSELRQIEEEITVELGEPSHSSVGKSKTFQEVAVDLQPTSWQQYKEQSEQFVVLSEETLGRNLEALVQPDQFNNIASLLQNLQIFETIAEVLDDTKRKLKISFDVYLPSNHFKKSHKVLPKFRIIVVKSTDSLPSHIEVDILRSSYQDKIPFLFAVVYDETVALYYYTSVPLPKYHDH